MVSQDLLNAIIQARTSNPSNFTNVASNYLLGNQFSLQNQAQIAATGTFNVTTPTGNFNIGLNDSRNGFITTPILNTLSGIQSQYQGTQNLVPAPFTPLNDQILSNNIAAQNNLSSGPNAASTKGLGDSFNTAISNASSFIKSHPMLLLAIVGVVGLTIFGAVRR